MALQKQPVTFNFSKGVDTKTDPWQVPFGTFLSLQNSVFTKQGQLRKRNGYGALPSLPSSDYSFATTFNGNLTAIGSKFAAFSSASNTWTEKGSINPVSLGVTPLIRNNLNQDYADCAVAANGLVCTVYTENNGGTLSYKYAIADSTTGQNIVAPTLIQGAGTATYAPRVFYLYPYFMIVFDDVVSAVNHLKYIAISVSNPSSATAATDISTAYSPASTGTFDGVVVGNNLYLVFNGSSTTIKATYITNTLSIATAKSFSSQSCTTISATADTSGSYQTVWASWIVPSTGQIKALALDQLLNTVLSPTEIVATSDAVNIASVATGGVLSVYYEVTNSYTYDSGIPTNYIETCTLTQGGSAGSPSEVVRSVGLASKCFMYGGITYFFALYNSTYQPTYFLIDENGNVVSRFAYENGPSTYYVTGLPSVSQSDANVYVPYLFKDLIQSVNKGTNLPTGSQAGGIYSQTGINLLATTFGTDSLVTSETGNSLNITGGFLGMYDGYLPVEQNFFLYPDDVEVTTATGSGGLIAQKYFYQFTYEWTDNQGNAFRSAPSIPVSITTTTASSTNTLTVPTLRLTYKIANPVKLVGYRWSEAQQSYYQFTSISAPELNDTTVDYLTITDDQSDEDILGNNLIYTTGGVLENVGAPSFASLFLFDDRLWGIDSENRNLLWNSKQIIQGTPVEMSDLLTIYVPPNTGAQGPAGPITCGFEMDEKAILFRRSSMQYFNGTGPDITGANGQYSQPVTITSTVGCSNQKSIVFMPNGLMFEFQSESGNQIWLLGRDLSTQYIGAPVEEYTKDAFILSAVNIPGTNQVRFTLSSGITLMYDYFYGQWGTFTNIPAISSTLYQGLHTFINASGQVFKETPNLYLDGSNPVLMSFATSWMNLAGLQGYERIYYFYLLGNYISPHKLNVQIAYEYNPYPSQSSLISPDNYNAPWGGDNLWGQSTPWGGTPTLEQWQIHTQRQLCQSFQILVNEIFDPSYGTVAGAGLTMSGVTCMVGLKKGYRPIKAATSVG